MADRKKHNIFYARTYRRLIPHRIEQLLYILLLVVPAVILYLFIYSPFTQVLSLWAGQVLTPVLAHGSVFGIDSHEYFP